MPDEKSLAESEEKYIILLLCTDSSNPSCESANKKLELFGECTFGFP